jgi:hypothetical protein
MASPRQFLVWRRSADRTRFQTLAQNIGKTCRYRTAIVVIPRKTSAKATDSEASRRGDRFFPVRARAMDPRTQFRRNPGRTERGLERIDEMRGANLSRRKIPTGMQADVRSLLATGYSCARARKWRRPVRRDLVQSRLPPPRSRERDRYIRPRMASPSILILSAAQATSTFDRLPNELAVPGGTKVFGSEARRATSVDSGGPARSRFSMPLSRLLPHWS